MCLKNKSANFEQKQIALERTSKIFEPRYVRNNILLNRFANHFHFACSCNASFFVFSFSKFTGVFPGNSFSQKHDVVMKSQAHVKIQAATNE